MREQGAARRALSTSAACRAHETAICDKVILMLTSQPRCGLKGAILVRASQADRLCGQNGSPGED